MNNSTRDADFVHFLESIVNLQTLEGMTMELDDELKDSQEVMNEIKGMIDALPVKVENPKSEPDGNGLRHEDISNFLSAGTPKLLMPDMAENTDDLDLDNIIATMKSYTEDLKKTLIVSELEQAKTLPKQWESLELEQYASSLDQMNKRLSNLKLDKKINNRNTELEAKLSILCDDVNMFTKMIQAKTSLSEANTNWSPIQKNTNALDYDNLIDKVLSGINEVSYLLTSKK